MPRTRRGRGEGSIYQRSDGRWCATFSVGYAGDGRRRRKTVFGETKKDVQDRLAKERSLQLDGNFTEPNKIRLAAYLARWLEDAVRPTVRGTTMENYRTMVDRHVSPRIGGLMLSKITPVHIQGLYSDLERDGASPRLRQLVHAVLRRALKQALRWGLVARNVCDAVEPPRVPRHEITPLNGDQVQILLQAAESERLYALFVLAVGTGMRLGELFALKWENVDLKHACLSVRYTLMELNGQLSLQEPKTAKSRRRIDIPQVAVDALRTHRANMLKAGQGGVEWVFCNLHGGPLRRSHFHKYVFTPLLKRAKVPKIRFHDLRHTSASLLLAAGVHPKVVQERLGHAQISITLDTYSHVIPTMGVEAAGKLDAVLANRRA